METNPEKKSCFLPGLNYNFLLPQLNKSSCRQFSTAFKRDIEVEH